MLCYAIEIKYQKKESYESLGKRGEGKCPDTYNMRGLKFCSELVLDVFLSVGRHPSADGHLTHQQNT